MNVPQLLDWLECPECGAQGDDLSLFGTDYGMQVTCEECGESASY